MPKQPSLFKIVTDEDGMIFIEGPSNLLLGIDYISSDHKKMAKHARKIVRLLGQHWEDSKKKAPTP